MKVTIVCVGRVKEKFYRDALAEYAKRLSRYCKLEVAEVADEMTPDGANAVCCEQIKEKEAKRILARIREDAYVCTLEIEGHRLSSTGFAEWIEKAAVEGRSDLVFVIGGSLGLHQLVQKRSDFALSFSDMTFPHQLMRVILSEQIYRAFRIIHGEPYHK
ncbi:MAG: 23S rRNA (pseudouridine(1915)-N(3))-methyltransferase RlmH [Candidatus Gastranaerophilales bacterium]|nr:23S rRNA (pseudouridine(1915)-N(3))-methyltransferase RlmH [Candidatus Gastranaerophilales bacterium]